jgi:hypothetical protein
MLSFFVAFLQDMNFIFKFVGYAKVLFYMFKFISFILLKLDQESPVYGHGLQTHDG